jgi:hypothetical protein
MAREILESARPVTGFFYSAFFALLLAPLGALPVAGALWVWGALQIAALTLLCVFPPGRLLGLSRRAWLAYLAICLTSLPVVHNVKWGQVSVLITLAILGALHLRERRRPVLAGIVLAVAASVNYYAGLFVILLLLERDWRAVVSFAGAGLLFFVMVPAVILGPADWLAFQRETLETIGGAAWVARDINSQYVAHVGQRVLQRVFAIDGTPGTARALQFIGLAVAVANLFLIRAVRRRRLPDGGMLSASVLFLTLPFLLRTSWPHYFVFLPFCQVAIFTRLERLQTGRRQAGRVQAGRVGGTNRTGAVLAMVAVALSVAAASVFAFNAFAHWALYSIYGLLFLANALLLAATWGLVGLSGAVASPTTEPGGGSRRRAPRRAR